MADTGDKPITSHYSKRKRVSVYSDLNEENIGRKVAENAEAFPPSKAPKLVHTGSAKGVVTLGGSTAPGEAMKAADTAAGEQPITKCQFHKSLETAAAPAIHEHNSEAATLAAYSQNHPKSAPRDQGADVDAAQQRSRRHDHTNEAAALTTANAADTAGRPLAPWPGHSSLITGGGAPVIGKAVVGPAPERRMRVRFRDVDETSPPSSDGAKTCNGVTYERKDYGPFSGKLVSRGAIITIDGEDYVEYRVLTKPSF